MRHASLSTPPCPALRWLYPLLLGYLVESAPSASSTGSADPARDGSRLSIPTLPSLSPVGTESPMPPTLRPVGPTQHLVKRTLTVFLSVFASLRESQLTDSTAKVGAGTGPPGEWSVWIRYYASSDPEFRKSDLSWAVWHHLHFSNR